MKLRKTDSFEGYSIEVKRFYLPFEIDWECPKCSTEHVSDFNCNYLSYPRLEKPEEHYLYCDECEFEGNILVKLTMDMELVDGKIIEEEDA